MGASGIDFLPPTLGCDVAFVVEIPKISAAPPTLDSFCPFFFILLFSPQGRSAEAASRHAVRGYFDSLRAEVARDRIKVTVVHPGDDNDNDTAHEATRCAVVVGYGICVP